MWLQSTRKFFLVSKNQTEDINHLGDRFNILRGHFDENKIGDSTLPGVKKLRIRVVLCPPQYKLIGCHRINSMTLFKVDDMYNASPLS